MERTLTDDLRDVTKDRKAVAERSYEDSSSKRLLSIVKTKTKTSFIGALAKVEQHIGTQLWGHGKATPDCTETELAWRAIWEVCRNEILNNGNNQLRAVENEFPQYSIWWNRYNTVLPAVQ